MKKITLSLCVFILSIGVVRTAQSAQLLSKELITVSHHSHSLDASCQNITIKEFMVHMTHIVGRLGCLIAAHDNPHAFTVNMASVLSSLSNFISHATEKSELSTQSSLQDLINYLERTEENKKNQLAHRVTRNNLKTDDTIDDTIIGSFVTMIGNFAHIFCCPRDPKVVSVNVAQIISGIVDVVRHALKKPTVRSQLCVNDELHDECAQLIMQACVSGK